MAANKTGTKAPTKAKSADKTTTQKVETAPKEAAKSTEKAKGKAAKGATPAAGTFVKETKPSVLGAIVATPAAVSVPAVNVEPAADADVILTDAEGRRYCRATDCDQVGIVDGYCRYHYLYFWKKIQVRKKILADGKLERYIEELTSRYTDKFIEILRKDTRTEKDFLAAVQELELDDSSSGGQQDEDETKSYLEEISGVAAETSTRDEDGY